MSLPKFAFVVRSAPFACFSNTEIMSDQTPPPKSSRKRSASDRMRYAERNGYDDYDETIDDSTVHRKIQPNTTEQYEVQMQLWREYVSTHPGVAPWPDLLEDSKLPSQAGDLAT